MGERETSEDDDVRKPELSGPKLQTLVDGLKTRSPAEVMGPVANSSLYGSIVSAAIGLVSLLLVMTVVVFFVVGPPTVKKTAEEQAPDITKLDATAQSAETTSETLPQEADVNAYDKSDSESDSTNAVEAMGIGETKDADSPTDSLDNRLDDLLKGLE